MRFAGTLAVVATIVFASGCASTDDDSQGATSTSGENDGSAVLEYSLDLDSTTVMSGGLLTGRVVVQNVSDEPVPFPEDNNGCLTSFGIGLTPPDHPDEEPAVGFDDVCQSGLSQLMPDEQYVWRVGTRAFTLEGPTEPLAPGDYVVRVASYPGIALAGELPEPTPVTVEPATGDVGASVERQFRASGLCSGTGEGRLVAAYPSTVADVQAFAWWRDGLWVDLDGEQFAAVCYIDGPVAKSPPPGPDGQVPPSHDRRVVAVVEDPEMNDPADGVVFLKSGYQDSMEPVAP